MYCAIILEDIHECETGIVAQRGDCVEWFAEGALCSTDKNTMPQDNGGAPRAIAFKQFSEMAPVYIAPSQSMSGPFEQEDLVNVFIIIDPSDMVTMLNPLTRETRTVPRTVIRDQGNVSHADIRNALLIFEDGRWRRYDS